MNRKWAVALLAFLLFLLFIQGAGAESVVWDRVYGTPDVDHGYGTSPDRFGNVFLAGDLRGISIGYTDVFLNKYDSAGNLLWNRMVPSVMHHYGCSGVATDTIGNAYVVGYAEGDFAGPNAGGADIFVRKYDTNGDILWTKQFGSNGHDYPSSINIDKLGNIFVAGTTSGSLDHPNPNFFQDAFVSKLDTSGNLLWSHQVGGAETFDWSSGVSADGLGDVYLTGRTSGSLGGPNAGAYDAFLVKYDSSGGLLWTRQLGSSEDDYGNDVTADELGNVYLTGATYGNVGGANAGSSDELLAKYDALGNLIWTLQNGSSQFESGQSVTTDGLGHLYLAATITAHNHGEGLVREYDSFGNLLWSQQLDTIGTDLADIAVDALGSAYTAGTSYGTSSSRIHAFEDAYLVKIADVPEPSTLALGAFGAAMLWTCRRRINSL